MAIDITLRVSGLETVYLGGFASYACYGTISRKTSRYQAKSPYTTMADKETSQSRPSI